MADISYVRGTTFRVTLNYKPAEGNGDGVTGLFTAKTEIDNDATDTQNDIMEPKNIPMTSNSCVIKINPEDVGMNVEKGGGYVWDIKVIDTNGEIYPAGNGKFAVDVTATNRITA